MSSSRIKHRNKSRTSSGEYCRGFMDKHGQWNNGFYCPKWGDPDRQYCCGPDDNKYCCPKEETQEKLHGNQAQQISLLIGLAIGSLVLLIATIVLSCYFCRCCWAYKRRKRLHATPRLPAYPGLSRDSSDPVNYAMCPHGTIFPEFMIPVPPYPSDAPPPYQVDEPALPLEDKQSLPPPDVHVEDLPSLHQETDIDQVHHYNNERIVSSLPQSDANGEQIQSESGDSVQNNMESVVIPHETMGEVGCHDTQDTSDCSVSPNDIPSTSSHHSRYQIPKFNSSHGHHGNHRGNHHSHHNHHRHHHHGQHHSHRYGYDSRSLSSTDSDSYTG